MSRSIFNLLSIFSPTPGSRRSYYATVFGDSGRKIPAIPAYVRVDKCGDSILELELPVASSMYNYQRQPWQPFFRINNKGNKIFVEKDNWLFGADKHLFQPGTKIYHRPLDEVIPPTDELYAIPQPVWEEFISKLNDKKVVELLNLNKHRHLWGGYNFALTADSEGLKHKRAGLIGNYHFLLRLIKPYRNGLEHQPLPFLELAQSNLENGIFSLKDMLKLHPCFTPAFLKKMAHCSSLQTVFEIADWVLRFSKFTQTNEDIKRRSDAINWLPSSVTRPKDFYHTLWTGRAFLMRGLPSSSAASFFFRSRKKWPNYDYGALYKIFNDLLFDYCDTLFDDLIVRELFQKTPAHRELTHQTIRDIKVKFLAVLADTTTIERMDFLQNRWHRNIHLIEALKPVVRENTWKPIINNMEVNGIKVNVLTSNLALKAHDREMQRCVGEYVEKCLLNEANIIELTDDKDEKSTLELRYEKGEVFIQQHSSYKDSMPKNTHWLFAKDLVSKINNGEITVNPERITQPPYQGDRHLYPYDPNNLAIQEEIYSTYKANRLLPKILIASNYQTMLEKSGMLDIIRELDKATEANEQEIVGARLAR